MEEVDPTTSHSQRQLDIDICGNDDKKLSDQPVEVVDVESATKVPMKLPSGVSQRIEVAAQTASIAKAQEDYKRSVACVTKIESDAIEKSHQIVNKMIEEITSTNSYLKVRIDEFKSINSLSETDGTNCKIDPAMEKVIKVATKLQKQINAVQVQLGICLFRVQDRRTADEAKRAYKSLGLLHSECNRIATCASATSSLYRYTIDLKDSLEAEVSRLPEETLKKIYSDLANLQEEK